MYSYEDRIKDMPHDTAPAWVDWIRETSKAQDEFVKETDHFIGVLNVKRSQNLVEGMPHPNAKHHLTFFLKVVKSGVITRRTTLQDLSIEELEDLQKIKRKFSRWFFYENAPADKTIERFHFHLIYTQSNKGTWKGYTSR